MIRTWPVIVALALATAAHADRLTVEQAQAEARAHAPDAAELDARLRGAEEVARAERRIFRSNPTLSGGYAPGPVVGRSDEQFWEIGLEQTFDVSGSWRSRGASAAAVRDATRAQREDGLRALDEVVAIAVSDLAIAERRLSYADRIFAVQNLAVEGARKQLSVGQGNRLDLDGAELDSAVAAAEVARARGALDSARVTLARWLGRGSDANLEVIAPPLPSVPVAAGDMDHFIDGDPRVRAADAEVRAAQLELQTHLRSIIPTLTLSATYSAERRDIPPGSFSNNAALSAIWDDRQLMFRLALPLPVFDRKQTERAQARSRTEVAEAQSSVVRAMVRQELGAAWADLQSAARAVDALRATPTIIDRELDLVDKAMRAGAIDALTRAFALRRLVDAVARYDTAVHDLQVAHARWLRRTRASE